MTRKRTEAERITNNPEINAVGVLRAYLMVRTPHRTSSELVDAIRRRYAQPVVAGSTVYGWYDVFIEIDVPNKNKFTTIIQELLHEHLDVTHIESAVERTAYHPFGTLVRAS